MLERGSEKLKVYRSHYYRLITHKKTKNRQLMESYTIAMVRILVSQDKAPELTEALNKFIANNSATHAEEARLGALRYILVKVTIMCLLLLLNRLS